MPVSSLLNCCPTPCCNNNPYQICGATPSLVTTLVVSNRVACPVVFCLTLSDGSTASVTIPGNPTGSVMTPTTVGPYPNGATITFLQASVVSSCSVNLLYSNTIPQLGLSVNVAISASGVLTFTV